MGQCKIDKLNLSGTVQRLIKSGVHSRSKIADELRSTHGVEISDATVGRYLARIKAAAGGKAFQIISDHVDRVVPEDLKALEAMEALTYKWSMEATVPRAERIAEVVSKISSEISEWKTLILESQDAEETAGVIIKKCLSYIAEDARVQEQRLKAMRMAVQIIDLKLSKAGLLEDDSRGRIVFIQRSKSQDAPPAAPGSSGAKLRLINKLADGEGSHAAD